MVHPNLSVISSRRSWRTLQRRNRLDFFSSKYPQSRSFAQKPSLLRVTQPILRPQLPFLHPVSRTAIAQAQVGRFISTERKQRWKEQLRRQLRFHAYLWPSVILLAILALGIHHTKLERDYPTPREWTFWSRWLLRDAKYTELGEEAKIDRIFTDWSKAGRLYQELLARLESEDFDGKFLMRGGSVIWPSADGVQEHQVFDISPKTEQWRRGYHDALMGAGRVAEHLDGMCRRKGEARGRVYSRENIPGPNNPRPKPLPWDKKKGHETPPTAEEVEDAFPSPESFYRRILNTRGFDTRQRLDAAMAYADWMAFKGDADSAERIYRQALGIAQSGLPAGRPDVVDRHTGIILKEREDAVTDNILKASTAMGVDYARIGRVDRALPIFLSVLKARKILPPSPPEVAGTEARRTNESQGLWPYIDALKDWIIERPYPPPPPSGNERPFHTLKEACEEVALMTYIGEILFATSQSEREKGLSWTRDSVEAAEAVMWVMDERREQDGKERCRQCLETGLQNWKDMARQMAHLAAKKEKEAENGSGLLGLGLGKAQQIDKARKEKQRWEEENLQIELRREKTLPLIRPLRAPVAAGGWLSGLF
ncbi:uncharacterized protein Z518_05594 [Rhinocladiella mackenziei CBS 650.93]|uniref:Uncharacterized protein n=1 Tax=Rhinocladiella mackenziei CBS 650.93 TaxID=1442369 RepID=A0A0D2IFZ2_9EURO|nr:uncharacterized protein Z518_05594 [Rhinocladiella mackenziei CBS 650.93]KIX04724.1 hypothetical protein Z518_05594 [Rhinocladiella mackenziei CBS 650.93]